MANKKTSDEGKENSARDIKALEDQHEILRKKAKEMFEDLNLDEDESEDPQTKANSDFTAT